MSRWQRVSMWLINTPWTGLAACCLAGGLNIVVAYRAESIPEIWGSLLIAGWIIGWGTGSLFFRLRYDEEMITKAQVYAEAEEFISAHADAWARESIRRAMAEARRHGVLPPNVEVYLADDEVPPGLKH